MYKSDSYNKNLQAWKSAWDMFKDMRYLFYKQI